MVYSWEKTRTKSLGPKVTPQQQQRFSRYELFEFTRYLWRVYSCCWCMFIVYWNCMYACSLVHQHFLGKDLNYLMWNFDFYEVFVLNQCSLPTTPTPLVFKTNAVTCLFIQTTFALSFRELFFFTPCWKKLWTGRVAKLFATDCPTSTLRDFLWSCYLAGVVEV